MPLSRVTSEARLATAKPQWAVVVFAARESAEAVRLTLEAIRAAVPDGSIIIDVLVNGNDALVRTFAQTVRDECQLGVRLWAIGVADKANAWSQYIHRIWDGEELVFFVDGYVRVRPDALRSLGRLVLSDQYALGGSGVPTTGRTAAAAAREMRQYGGFQGNLCCMKGKGFAEMRRHRIGLPVGLYRVDSLVSALMHLAFDPQANSWDGRRVRVDPAASWVVSPKHWWRWRDLVAKYRRSVRQARGLVENEAIKDHLMIAGQPPESLPRHMDSLVRAWCRENPRVLRGLTWRNPLVYIALRRLASTEQLSDDDLTPRFVCASRTHI